MIPPRALLTTTIQIDNETRARLDEISRDLRSQKMGYTMDHVVRYLLDAREELARVLTAQYDGGA